MKEERRETMPCLLGAGRARLAPVKCAQEPEGPAEATDQPL